MAIKKTTKKAAEAKPVAAKKAPAKKPVAKKAEAKKAASTKKRVTFTVAAEPGKKVFVTGSFNNWDSEGKQLVDKKGDGNYAVTVSLEPGTYEYKFVINGTWSVDPNCKEWIQNSLGTLNSVLHVE